MRKTIAYTAASLMIAAALPAYASDEDDSCGPLADGQQLSVQDITAKAEELGYDVRKVEREDGCFEVHAIDKNGARVEFNMNPVTGEILRTSDRS